MSGSGTVVRGGITYDAFGNVIITGVSEIGGTLLVEGAATFSGTVATGVLTPASLVVTGAATVGTTMGVTGILTPSGGVAGTTPLKIYNVAPQGVITARGTDGVSVAGTTYYAELFLPVNKTITGIAVLTGTTTTNDKALVILYDAAGNLLANSATAGATTSTADKYQQFAFDPSPVAVVGPTTVFIAFQLDGTTDGMQRIATDGVEVIAASFVGSFGTIVDPIAAVATTFTTALGPIGYVY